MGGSYSPAETQSVYSTAPADWVARSLTSECKLFVIDRNTLYHITMYIKN